MAEERLIAHVLRAELTMQMASRGPGAERTAATAAQERLLPLLTRMPGAPGALGALGVLGLSEPDPEGWQALLRAVQARAVARLGDLGGLRRWTQQAERRCEGVGIPGRVRVHLALGHAWSEGPAEGRSEGVRRLEGALLWAEQLGFRGLVEPHARD